MGIQDPARSLVVTERLHLWTLWFSKRTSREPLLYHGASRLVGALLVEPTLYKESVSAPCPATQEYDFAMSRELADGLAVTAMAVRMEVSIHATAGSFALSRQRARRPPRLEREFQNRGLP